MLFIFLNFALSKIILNANDERKFLNWMRNYNTFYTGEEYHLRLGIFLTNIRFIQAYNNKKGITFHLSMNKFSCFTPSEYKSLLGLKIPVNFRKQPNNYGNLFKNKVEVPDSIDWRESDVVISVKDQGNCGSCWAFSAIATSESAFALKSKSLISFSEQNLIDCCTDCSGCKGGWPELALDFILNKQNGQFNAESDYPYKAVKGYCNYDSTKSIGKITNYIEIAAKDENIY